MHPVLDKVRRPARARNRAGGRASTQLAPLLLPALAFLALACGDDRGVDPVPVPVPVATVTVSPAELTLAAAATATLEAVARAADGTVLEGRPVTWTATPAAVATVSATGTVTAHGAGTATVTATIGGRAGTARIVVPTAGESPPPSLVRPSLSSIAPTQITDGWGGTFTLTVTGADFARGAIVVFGGSPLQTTWVSPTVLHARVTAAEVALVGTFGVRVVNPPLPAELYSEPVTFTVVARTPSLVRVTSPAGAPWTWAGDLLPLAAQALDLAGQPLPNRVPLWTTDRPDVVRLSPTGAVAALSPGSALVTATVDGVSGRIGVRVHRAPDLGMVWDHGTGAARRLAIWFPGRGEPPTPLFTPIPAWDPSPSPDGRRIAFAGRGADGNIDVYVITRGGGAMQRLTTADGIDDMPAWSPDGTTIAFRSTRAGRSDVWVMNADGSNPRPLTAPAGTVGPAASGDPAWSPTGEHLAFASGAGLERDVWIMRADGTGQRRLTSDAADEREPAWSPDGTKIAYRHGTGANAQVVVRWAHDGTPVILPMPPGAGATPAFAPGGAWLAYSRASAAGHTLLVQPFAGGDGSRSVFGSALDAGANVAWLTP